MVIHHIGLWVKNLEKMKDFYENYFSLKSGAMYSNKSRGFYSYFLSGESGAAIELMYIEDKGKGKGGNLAIKGSHLGLAHIAFDLETPQSVNDLTERLRKAGFEIYSEPRVTGDGYYESVILDPEGNIVELVAK